MSENTNVGGIDGARLLSFVERLERIEEEAKEVAETRKDVMTEIKSSGYEGKHVKWLVSQRKREKSEREDEENIRALYAKAVNL